MISSEDERNARYNILAAAIRATKDDNKWKAAESGSPRAKMKQGWLQGESKITTAFYHYPSEKA